MIVDLSSHGGLMRLKIFVKRSYRANEGLLRLRENATEPRERKSTGRSLSCLWRL